jgi:cell division protease FtsH
MEDNYNNNSTPGSGNDDKGDKKGNSGKRRNIIFLLIVSILLSLICWNAYDRIANGKKTEIPYSGFVEMLEDGQVEEAEIYSGKIKFTIRDDDGQIDRNSYYTQRIEDDNLANRLKTAHEKYNTTYKGVNESSGAIIETILYYALTIGVFFFFLSFLSKRGGIMNVGKSNAKIYMEKKTGVTFADVAGEDEAKESLTEMVDFLHNPKRYLDIGAKLPKGALLVGPPGTGKTLLAKAVAGEANVPFFSMSGSGFVEMYVGVGASRVRDLFKQAADMAPCIIFIDEIDAIGQSRDGRHGGDSEREQTLNQLLAEMDGFDTSKGIVILAATNRPEILDKALLRPGRFDRRVIVEKPDLQGRIDTLKVHSKNVKMDESVDLHELALATAGAVGADLANIINEAALTAVRSGRNAVSQADLIGAVELVFAGKEKKGRLLGEQEKRVVAYHEVGHAMLVALQKHTEPVQRITIVPRTMGSLGYVWQVPEEEKYMETKAELEANIVTTLGGRAAEELKFDSVTTGAANDIEQATKTARSMITMYGMSEKFGLMQLESVNGKYLDRNSVLECSDQTAAMIDEEIKEMLRKSYEQAKALLSQHMEALDAIAEFLIEKENITGKEFMEIFDRVESKNQQAGEETDED